MQYRDRQLAQYRRFMRWVKSEGGVELPTQLTTLMQPHQRLRLDWLRDNVTGRVLEVGANYGFVLAWVGGHVGLDISPMNVALARLLNPTMEFQQGDAVQLPFRDHSFGTVMVPETLEHLDWPDGVKRGINEALRVARQRILITVPDGRTDAEDAINEKHMWLLDEEYAKQLMEWLPGARITYNGGFALVRADLEGKS